MIIETRDFGRIEISEEGILTFKLPILGFEEEKQFIILYDDEVGDSLAWLQSVNNRDICFIIMDPCLILNTYTPVITPAVLDKLGLAAQQDAVLRCLVVVPNRTGDATINLKSPLVINPAKKLAAQVILDEDYPIRTSLRKVEEGSLC